jgi:hypothetical protein
MKENCICSSCSSANNIGIFTLAAAIARPAMPGTSVVDPDPDWIHGRAKMGHKNRKKLINFIF